MTAKDCTQLAKKAAWNMGPIWSAKRRCLRSLHALRGVLPGKRFVREGENQLSTSCHDRRHYNIQ